MEKRVFPICAINKNSRVILYGAGNNSREMYRQNIILRWCEIIAVVDKNYNQINDYPVEVDNPECISNYEYDYIIITVENPDIRKSIYLYLDELGVQNDKVIMDIDYFVEQGVCGEIIDRVESTESNKNLVVGFLPGGVMGDNIISLRLYKEIVSLVPNSEIDVFTCFNVFPENVFYGQKNLREIIHRLPKNEDREKYDLIIQSHFEPSLIYCNLSRLEQVAPSFKDNVLKLYAYQSRDLFMCYPAQYMNRIQWDRSKFMGYTCYTLLGSSGAFDIKDYQVDFPLNKSYEKEFRKLNLGEKYITFSYGVSDPLKNGKSQTKMWPKENYEKLISLIKSDVSNIKVIQVDAKFVDKVTGADGYILGENLEVVKYVLKNAICHVDCEGGLVHMATQLGTKCFVVFGPTPVSFFGYDKNVNFIPKSCRECCGIVKDWYTRCYKYGDARCMRETTAEEVYTEIIHYLF